MGYRDVYRKRKVSNEEILFKDIHPNDLVSHLLDYPRTVLNCKRLTFLVMSERKLLKKSLTG